MEAETGVRQAQDQEDWLACPLQNLQGGQEAPPPGLGPPYTLASDPGPQGWRS